MQRTALALCLTIAFTNPNVNAIVFWRSANANH